MRSFGTQFLFSYCTLNPRYVYSTKCVEPHTILVLGTYVFGTETPIRSPHGSTKYRIESR